MSELQSLLERVEAAEVADREIDDDLGDYDVSVALSLPIRQVAEYRSEIKRRGMSDPYTGSVDAALSLIGRVLPETTVLLDTAGPHARVRRLDPFDGDIGALGATPALALVAAMLRALIAKAAQ
jgi:hypothetical protein